MEGCIGCGQRRMTGSDTGVGFGVAAGFLQFLDAFCSLAEPERLGMLRPSSPLRLRCFRVTVLCIFFGWRCRREYVAVPCFHPIQPLPADIMSDQKQEGVRRCLYVRSTWKCRIFERLPVPWRGVQRYRRPARRLSLQYFPSKPTRSLSRYASWICADGAEYAV